MTFITQIGLILTLTPSPHAELASPVFWVQVLTGLIIGVPLLFAPTIIARYRNHPKKDWIFTLNFLSAWTGFGWILLLIWSLGPKNPIRSAEEYRRRYPLPGSTTLESTPIEQQPPGTSDAVLASSSKSSSNSTVIASAILGGALIIGLAIFASIRLSYPGRKDAEKNQGLATFRSTATPAPSVVTRPDSIVNKAKAAVVELVAYDANWSQIATGTGFFVSADGELLTNFHVIEGATHISAGTEKGAIFIFEKFVTGSADSDVALLKFQAADVDFLKLGTSTNAVEGETVFVIGNPEGLTGTVSNGIISSFRKNRSYIQITAPISPGSSGSPVLDETGQVIGMASGGNKEGQNLNFAVSAEAIEAAIQKISDIPPEVLPRGIAEATPSPLVTPSPTPDEKLASNYFSKGLATFKSTATPAPSVVPLATPSTTEPPQTEESLEHDFLSSGRQYLDQKQYSEAVKLFTTVIQGNPKSKDAFFFRGLAFAELNEDRAAIADFSKAIELDPSDTHAYSQRGKIFKSLGRYTEALSDFTKAIELNKPDKVILLQERANLYDKMGDKKKAERDRADAGRQRYQ